MDHYEDTFGIILMHWKVRNRLFIYALILLALIAIDQFSGCSLADIVNDYLENRLGKTPEGEGRLDFAAVDFIARFVLLCVVIQYYQRSIQIDRMYKYIHRLEGQLCEFMGADVIAREGKAYLSRTGVPESNLKDNRPWILKRIGPLYTHVFPAALSLLAIFSLALTIKSIRQCIANDQLAMGHLGIDILSILCSVGIVFYSVLYMVWVELRR
jgi:hypothetical protein